MKPRARSRRSGRRAVLALLLTGCSYDWSVASVAPSDAGRDAVPADVGVADAADAAIADAKTVFDGADAGPTDSGNQEEAAPSCAELIQAVAGAFEAAKSCGSSCTPSSCMTQTADPCGCTVVVCNGMMNQATHDYVAAVTTLKGSGCLAQYPCPDGCAATTAACLLVSDAGDTYGCYY